MPRTSPSTWASRASSTRSPSAPRSPAWPPAWRGPRSAATSSSSRPRRCRARAGCRSPGQLGEVMQESAKAALTFVRSNADVLAVDPAVIERHDVHIHVPAGAVPKDGPSAGVTMFTALTSLFTGRRVRPDTAMTGEVTLRGRVLPVGGIKEKVIAAHRAGITRVILPSKNQRDVDDIPPAVREALEILFADDMLEVLQAALEPVGSAPPVGAGGHTAASA
ncbi:MAG: S16 family serine protease [Nannocystaceae bacterium]